MQKERRVVITGIGLLTSIGIGKENFWKSALEAKTNVKLEECLIGGSLWEKFYLHKIENFDINNFGIDKIKLEDIKNWKENDETIDLYYLLAATKLAIEDSHLEYEKEDNDISCVITHENPGLEEYFFKIINRSYDKLCQPNKKLTRKEFFESLYKDLKKTSYELQTFMVLFHILKTFDFHGYSLFLNNACSSGLYAIETASQIIKAGRAPVSIVVAADHPRAFKYLWFKYLNLYAEDGKIKPFSQDANGLVFGDAAVGLVLEDLEHAEKRRAKIYAEYLGGGFSQESWKVTLPYVGGNFYQKAINEAIFLSKIKKTDIDLLITHGVGSPIIDRYEASAIVDVFGIKSDRPLITALKPYVGHNLGATALLETAIAILCLENNIVLPVLNTKEIDPKAKINLIKEKTKAELKVALKICCAFAGYNGAIILKKI